MSDPTFDRAGWVEFLSRQADLYEAAADAYPGIRWFGREPRDVAELRAAARELRLLARTMDGPFGHRPPMLGEIQWRM